MEVDEFNLYYRDYINFIKGKDISKLSTQVIVEMIYKNNHTLEGKNSRKCVNIGGHFIGGKGRAMSIIAKHISFYLWNIDQNPNYQYIAPTKDSFAIKGVKDHYDLNRKVRSKTTNNTVIFAKLIEYNNYLSNINEKIDKIMKHHSIN